jgi:hypothetical protein
MTGLYHAVKDAHMALILCRVMRMRLRVAKRSESPSTLLEQLKRIHQQIVQTGYGKTFG